MPYVHLSCVAFAKASRHALTALGANARWARHSGGKTAAQTFEDHAFSAADVSTVAQKKDHRLFCCPDIYTKRCTLGVALYIMNLFCACGQKTLCIFSTCCCLASEDDNDVWKLAIFFNRSPSCRKQRRVQSQFYKYKPTARQVLWVTTTGWLLCS